MKQKRRFVTLFTETENFHLVKDVGQILYFIYKKQGYVGELVTYQNNEDYPYLKNEVNGLRLTFIPDKGRIFYFEKSVIQFLLKESKSIDVLNLIHFKRDNILYLMIYKLLNPKGNSYIKLNMSSHFLKNYNSFFSFNYKLKNYLLKNLGKWISRLANILSVETEDARDYLLMVYPELINKLICIPNGVDSDYLEREISLKTFEEKENILIIVGRTETVQKNTEMLFEALRITDLDDRKVYIIKPIKERFKDYINKFFKENLELEYRIIFKGIITNREKLFERYNRAKIFCMNSIWESFGNVFIEALYFRNYIITTPVSSKDYMTNNGKYGTIAEAVEFSKVLQKCIKKSFLNTRRFKELRNYSKANYTWKGIIKKLTDKPNSGCVNNY